MSNFFTDNPDLMFVFDNLDIQEIVKLREENYTQAEKFDYAPENYEDASDSYRRVLDVLGEITGERIAPRAETVDEEGPHFENGKVTYHPLTQQNLDDLNKAGLMGMMLPRRFGGLNFPNTIYTMATELISRADASLQNLVCLQDIAMTINDFASEEQKQKYLPDFAVGKADGAMDLTEPDSGSDLQSVRLKATQGPDGKWYLNGMKRFITNGCAKTHLVLARSVEGSTDGRGLSMFICQACPQLVVRRIEHKLGIHGVATCELQYNNVPAELCGKPRFGLIKYVMSLMNGARMAISAQALGIAEAAYREARKYASEREQFKKSIDQFPAIYDMLTKMKTLLTASRTLMYETTKVVDLRYVYGQLVDSGKATPEDKDKYKAYDKMAAILTPLSKALCTEAANKIAYDCIQIHGGTGYMHDFPAQRLYRDARITNIYEGTTQLQVVAAIGGVMQRVLDPLITERFEALKAADPELLGILKDMYAKHLEEVAFTKTVSDTKNAEYHDLRAKNLVDNETFIFVGQAMLRDAQKDPKRACIAECYLRDAYVEFNKNNKIIMSGDVTIIEKHRDVIDY